MFNWKLRLKGGSPTARSEDRDRTESPGRGGMSGHGRKEKRSHIGRTGDARSGLSGKKGCGEERMG